MTDKEKWLHAFAIEPPAEPAPLDAYMDGIITTMDAQERLNYDRPAIPVPDFIERELARMDELETAPDSSL